MGKPQIGHFVATNEDFPEFKEDASIRNYNLAFKKKAYTLDAGKLGQEIEKRLV